MSMPHPGAVPLPGGGCRFCVYAPLARTVETVILSLPDTGEAPTDLISSPPPKPSDAPPTAAIAMTRLDDGHWICDVPRAGHGTRYRYRVDGGAPLPDPASRHQPDGVHGDSAMFMPPRKSSVFSGLPMPELVISELHVGTFTPQGTFEAVIPRLDALREVGITAIELLPVAQFPGARNWGYDGVFPYAAQNTYGGPAGLARLATACHERGMALLLDAVFNHLGPEGNHLAAFGPYFSSAYRTPWGPALNFDDAHSPGVRRFFLECARWWLEDMGLDGLRLDATSSIYDRSAVHFLEELAAMVRELRERTGRQIVLVAESERADPRVARPVRDGGMGFDGMWNDDFHHALHAALTGERNGYYADYADFAETGDLVRALGEGMVYQGQVSSFRKAAHGAPPRGLSGDRFTVCSQNHDQIGNRPDGARLLALTDLPRARLAAALTLLSPFTPLLFMGEEYGETAPFHFFVDFAHPGLNKAVRRGRRRDLRPFGWKKNPPDPAAETTFAACVLDWKHRETPEGRDMLALYGRLLRLRRECGPLRNPDPTSVHAESPARGLLRMQRRNDTGEETAVCLFNCSPLSTDVPSLENDGPREYATSTEETVVFSDGYNSPQVSPKGESVPARLAPWGFAILLWSGEAEK